MRLASLHLNGCRKKAQFIFNCPCSISIDFNSSIILINFSYQKYFPQNCFLLRKPLVLDKFNNLNIFEKNTEYLFHVCDGFKEVFFFKILKNERRTYLTNFIAVSISNGHITKLNSNFVLALSLSY